MLYLPVFLTRGKGGFMMKIKKLPNNCNASDVGAVRFMAFIAAVVAAILGNASCGKFGLDGLQSPVCC